MQIGVVTVVAGVGFALVGWMLDAELTDQYGQRALAVARTVAANPVIADAAAREDPNHVIQPLTTQIRLSTGALFVVVTDHNGIRLSHTDPTKIGLPVSTDPSEALSGRTVVNVQRGTLGLSVRAKVPLRDQSGAIVGEVSVGFDANDVRVHVIHRVAVCGLFAGAALLLGVTGSILLTRRLRRQTLGLEPGELAELVQEREAVLHGIGEGVLAVDSAGRVSVCNREAARLLGWRAEPGTPVSGLPLPIRLRAMLTGEGPADNVIAVVGDRVLIANRRAVRRDGRNLGVVLTLRDRTELETLTRELDTVRNLTAALRAQRHEFANRLHTLAGLLQTNHHAEAVEYLHALSGPTAPLGSASDAIQDPYLQAFLAAKMAEARERGVELKLGETSWVPTRVSSPVEVTTVVGNLIDNAMEAARLGVRSPAWVEVHLVADRTTLHVSVGDSGDGVPEELRERIFLDGVSTQDGEGHGQGLALASNAADERGGWLRLTHPGDESRGAVFAAELPGVLVADPENDPAGPPTTLVGAQ